MATCCRHVSNFPSQVNKGGTGKAAALDSGGGTTVKMAAIVLLLSPTTIGVAANLSLGQTGGGGKGRPRMGMDPMGVDNIYILYMLNQNFDAAACHRPWYWRDPYPC